MTFNKYKILTDAGKVSHKVAKALAEKEYESFRIAQDCDFEREAARVIADAESPKRERTKT